MAHGTARTEMLDLIERTVMPYGTLSALQALGYVMLQDHMETCVVEEIQNGNTAIVDEAIELVKKLK